MEKIDLARAAFFCERSRQPPGARTRALEKLRIFLPRDIVGDELNVNDWKKLGEEMKQQCPGGKERLYGKMSTGKMEKPDLYRSRAQRKWEVGGENKMHE